MPLTIDMQKKRDKKEQKLSSLKAQQIASQDGILRSTAKFEKEFKDYQTWKTENSVDGIKW